MQVIQGRINRKKAGLWIILGTLFIAINFYMLICETSNKITSVFQLIIGFCWVGYGIYQLKNDAIKIKWDHHKLTIKYLDRKPIVYNAKEITSFVVTRNNLIVNSGKANGEMIEIKFFNSKQKQELQLLQKEINEI